MRWYYRWRGAEPDPTAGIRLRPPPRPPKRPFSQDELRRLLAACKRSHERALVLLLVDTGLRLSEVAALRAPDVDWHAGTIRVQSAKGEQDRLAALSRGTLAALQLCMNGHDYPWPSQRIHGPMTRDGLYRLVRRLGQRAGVHAFVHRFRTTFACQFAEATEGDVQSLQVLMGHRKIETTLAYAAWGKAQRALAAQRRIALAERLFLPSRSAGAGS